MRTVQEGVRLVLRGGVLAGALLLSGPAWGLSIQTVALTGDVAPGAGGAVYSGFIAPALDDSGRTAFFGILTGSGVSVSNSTGIWSEGSGSLALVARAGDVAPGTSSATYGSFNAPVLNDAGQTAFGGVLALGGGVTSSNDHGIWSEGSGSLGLVAREGHLAPGTASATYAGFGAPVLNDSGETAFRGTLTGSTNISGIWSGAAGSLALVARAGDAAPGVTGAVYSDFTDPLINDSGQTAFRGVLALGGSVTSSNDHGIWSEGSGSLALVAREGSLAPGTASATYAGFGTPVLNDSGETAFRGTLTGSTNISGIWSGGAGSLALVARAGDAAPGATGAFYSSFTDPLINDSGDTLFSAFLTGAGVDSTNDRGIWLEGTGSLALVVREGDIAPGAGSAEYRFFGTTVLNDGGQTAFFGALTGSGVTASNNTGIWAQNSAGVLELIAREGDLLEVAPGDNRTVSSLSFFGNTGNGDGRASGFNNSGELAFLAGFTDGSRGIFLSSFDVQAPAPGTLGLLGMGLLGVMASARRSRRGVNQRRV